MTTGSKRDQRNRSKEFKTEGRGQGVEDELDGNMESLACMGGKKYKGMQREGLETN